MTHNILINKEKFQVNSNEYNKIYHEEYNNLNILDQLGFHERQISLLNEISMLYEKVNIKMTNVTHGGFIPIKCSNSFDKIYINNNIIHQNNILKNIISHLQNKNIYYYEDQHNEHKKHNYENEYLYHINYENPKSSIIISDKNKYLEKFVRYELTNLSTKWTPQPTLYVYVSESMNKKFFEKFKYYIYNNQLDYDNLIHLCIMVKNGGPQFEDMLNKNMDNIDKWTILDTGSTDNTIDIINKTIVNKKEGELYQEPFINFRDSRNRCLDLAGKKCKFIIMLDDTYIIDGKLREFLNIVRGDQLSTSYTLMIFSDDTQYGSNRIIKSDSDLRYIHKIHEVITDKNNINIVIPMQKVKIIDNRFDYMEERTMKRKELDLKLLYEEIEDDPTNPRTYYYLAQTYNLLGEYEKSYSFFMKRASFSNSGFIQERIDAIFEAARLANFKLNKPWEEFMDLYEKAYKTDESRPDSLYFMGINHYLRGENIKAYEFFKKGFEIGYPSHCQYSLKPTISYHFLPKFLTRLCYIMEDYILGEKASLLFLQNNKETSEDYEEIKSYYMIFTKLNEYHKDIKDIKYIRYSDKPLFVFVADGGFNKWSGSNILTTGVGGSETYIIEMARFIQKSGSFQVMVFCNCEKEEIFEGVEYKNIKYFPIFINENYVKHCMISRFTEYLPLTLKGFSENVYLVLHDLGPSGNVIPMDKKLKKIFCLTEWHVNYFIEKFPSLASITVPFYYGIDHSKFNFENNQDKKEKFKFIYSSFPNRGLLPLLKMWPKIYEMNKKASLHIYSDINGKWVNTVEPIQMSEIKKLLSEYTDLNIHYYGWVDKKTLSNAWLSSDIWFYPCIFMETFCLTALEAAITKTLVITNDLAALQNTVSDRGIVIKGNPMDKEWQDKALEKIKIYFENNESNQYDEYREKNYKWGSSLSWENQAKKLLKEYIYTNSLEYMNKYVDFDDMFKMILKYEHLKDLNNKNKKVLDIGTHTGVSLINILKNLPDSTGYIIDKWNENVEKSFDKNTKQEGLDQKIYKNYSDDITDLLLNYLGYEYDVININNINNDIDNIELIYKLVWKLLRKGGLLITYNKKEEDVYIPLLKINKYSKPSINFTEKYKLLGSSKTYQKDTEQLFLEKI